MFLSEQELNTIATEYDMAIRQYEMYYQQEMSAYARSSYATEACAYLYAEGFKHLEQLMQEYDQSLAQYEETLQSLEQVRSYFDMSLQHVQSLEGQDKEGCIAEWEYSLKETLETARQLMDSLERSVDFISAELEHENPF